MEKSLNLNIINTNQCCANGCIINSHVHILKSVLHARIIL